MQCTLAATHDEWYVPVLESAVTSHIVLVLTASTTALDCSVSTGLNQQTVVEASTLVKFAGAEPDSAVSAKPETVAVILAQWDPCK